MSWPVATTTASTAPGNAAMTFAPVPHLDPGYHAHSTFTLHPPPRQVEWAPLDRPHVLMPLDLSLGLAVGYTVVKVRLDRARRARGP